MQHLDLLTMRQLFLQKKLSPTEVVEDYLVRIEKNASSNIYITVNAEQAKRQAEIATQRYFWQESTGVLDGIPVAYKDNLFTKGIPSTAGSIIEKDHIPEENAPAVEIMQQAGAVNLGKLNMHEYAFGITSNNPFFGAVQNPWNKAYTPGGSSGGSGAALAADLAVVTLGTDTGGSIRIPAAACGVIGFKTTKGHISGEGARPISSSLDQVGPLTKTVSDMALMLELYDQQSYVAGLQRDLKGIRVGVPTSFFLDYLEPQTRACYEQSLQQLQDLGAVLVDVDVPVTPHDIGTLFTLAICEGAAVHAERLKAYPELFGADVKQALSAASQFSPVDYIRALEQQVALTQKFNALFLGVDLLATPTVGFATQKIGVDVVSLNGVEHDLFSATTHTCAPFNLTGHPAISIPCGIVENNLPVGLQLVGAHHSERLILQMAYAYEQAYLGDLYQQRQQLAL